MRARLLPPLVLAALTLIFFADLVLRPGQVLYSDTSDLLAEHVPAKRFLVRSWRETGELPLWCPYTFAGSPFVHDPQVGAFYPPHALLFLLPEERVGAALSWLVVLHLFLGGCGAYAYARRRGLATLPALVAGCGFLFAGKWLLHLLAAGHTITAGLAWLPWLLLALESALRRRSLTRATVAGVLLALMILGTQPQWTFYAGLFVVLWTLPLGTDRKTWTRWIGHGAWAAVVALALAAVQLLPTLEAAAQSTRGGGVPTDDVLPGGLRTLLFFVGPALTTTPTCLTWEDRGGFGLLWVVAAALAPLLRRGRVRYEAGVCLALVLFALGGAILFQRLPGFNLFRQPARMLLVVAFPVAYFAGVTTQTLFVDASPAPEMWDRCRRVLTRLTAAVVILSGGFALRLALTGETPRPHAYWASLALTVPATFFLLRGRARRGAAVAWSLVLLTDLWALGLPLVGVRPEEEVYPRSACVAALGRPRPGAFRVLDRDAPATSAGTPLGGGAPVALLDGLEAVRGYNPLDNRRVKEYLLLMGGEDRALRPFKDPLAFPVIENFPVVHKPLLDLLGVRYVLQPTELPRLPGDGWRAVHEDPSPAGYDFIDGGVRPLPPYTLWENADALPRAFVVPEASPLPDGPARAEALTTTDFRRRVLVEDCCGDEVTTGDDFRPAKVTRYTPNRVVVAADGPGWLVLADVWYPGWRCAVDGRSAPLYRADFLFRATPLPAGAHTIAFTFEPDSYYRGRIVSLATLGALLFGLAVRGVSRFRRWP